MALMSVNREVCVLLLRSIRRRLVTGFTVALGFMLLMTAAAIWGLAQHQNALSDIEYLVHESPDCAQLQAKINVIVSPITAAARAVKNGEGHLQYEQTVFDLRTQYLQNVQSAQAEAAEFWKRSERVVDSSDQPLGLSRRRNILQTNMRKVTDNLKLLQAYAAEFSALRGHQSSFDSKN